MSDYSEDYSYTDSYSTPPDYEVPSDLVSSVQPSEFLSFIYQQPVILFNEMGNRVPEFIRTSKYGDVPPFNGIPITDSCRLFINAFNSLSRNDIQDPPRNIADYANYITTLIPQKACFQIANSWPLSIPRITSQVEPLVAILIKITAEVNDPINFLRFLTLNIFPKVWTSKSSAINPVLAALSPCKYHKKDGYWAYIIRSKDRNELDEFFLVTRDKKTQEVVVKAQGLVTKCAKAKDNISVIVKGEAGRIADFTPLDPNVVPLWTHLYREEESEEDENTNESSEEEGQEEKQPKSIPFPYFLTRDWQGFIPDIAYPAFYEAITSNDGIFVRALLEQEHVPYNVVQSVLTLALHTKKITPIYGQVIGHLLEDDDLNPMAIYAKSSDTFYRKFIHALFERFSQPYLTDFLRKIIVLIDQSDESKLSEKTFFNTIKYLTMSSRFIPVQIRHFASMLRSYSLAKFNSRGFTYFLLGGFFGLDFICPILANPEKYFPEMPIRNKDMVKHVSELLQFVFHGSLLPDQYASWNNRVRKHILPLLDEFLFSIGDLVSMIPDIKPPLQSEIAPAIDRIMHQLLSDPRFSRRSSAD